MQTSSELSKPNTEPKDHSFISEPIKPDRLMQFTGVGLIASGIACAINVWVDYIPDTNAFGSAYFGSICLISGVSLLVFDKKLNNSKQYDES